MLVGDTGEVVGVDRAAAAYRRRDGKGECPSSLTSSRTAFSCTSRQRHSTGTGVRRWNATNVGGAKKQTERAARWNRPSGAVAATTPLGRFHRAARSVCFFAPPTFVAFHRRTPVPVECRCLLVHEKAVRELVSEDGHSPFPSRRPGSRSS